MNRSTHTSGYGEKRWTKCKVGYKLLVITTC
jgi:hypothetical protein